MNRMMMLLPLGLPFCFVGGALSNTPYQVTAALLVVGGAACVAVGMSGDRRVP